MIVVEYAVFRWFVRADLAAAAAPNPDGPEPAAPRYALVVGLDRVVDALVPARDGLPQLLAVAGVAAVLANLVNKLPATLVLLPAVERSPGLLLAVLIGVNVGPNLTYPENPGTHLRRRAGTGPGNGRGDPAGDRRRGASDMVSLIDALCNRQAI